MKKILALMLVLLMAFAVGCITGSDSKDKDSDTDTGGSGTGSSAKAAEYLPLQVGATWKWETTDDQGYSYGSTETITGTTSLGGKEYYVISDDDGEDTYIRLDNNIAYMYLEEEWAAKAHARGATFEVKDVPMFDFSKSAGKTWSIYSDSQSEQGNSFTIKMTGKYVGLKSVTVPAGAFSNCAVFEITVNMQYSSTFGNESFSGNFTVVATHYFAKGVGPVKVATKGTDTTNGEKTESTETQECTYYSIPGGASGGDPNSGGGGGGTTYSVTGEVKDSSGKGISGVLMELSGTGAVYTLTTDSQGRYTFEDVSNGEYTVTPAKSGYTFTPPTRQASVSGSNLTVSAFAGAVSGGGGKGSYSISGVIVNYGSSKGVADVTVELRDNLEDTLLASMMTDSDGVYSFTGLADGSYAVSVEKAGYFFDPLTRFVKIDGASVTGMNFEGWGGDGIFVVSGTVTDASGSGIAGASVTLEDMEGRKTTVLTTSSGGYTIRDVSSIADYILTVSHRSYTFTAPTQTFTVTDADITADFSTSSSGGGNGGGTTTGTGIGTGSYTVSGRVVDSSGKGIAGIKVTIFDEYKEASAITDSNGYYSIKNIATGSYGLYCDETDNYEFSPWIGYVAVEGKDATAEENFVGTPPKD